MKISKRLIRMVQPDGFDEIFNQELKNYDTYEKCFNALNAEYREVFGEPRYSTYDSYRLSRRKRIKKVS